MGETSKVTGVVDMMRQFIRREPAGGILLLIAAIAGYLLLHLSLPKAGQVRGQA